MLTEETRQSFPSSQFLVYHPHISVFFAAYLPRALVVNVNDEMFGFTLDNYSQKIKLHTWYTLSMMKFSHKRIMMIRKTVQILISEHFTNWLGMNSN